MGYLCVAFVMLSTALVGQDSYYGAINTAAADLQNQLDFLRRSFATIPGPPTGRGLYKEANGIFIDLIYFRQIVQQKEPREDLYLAFTKVDMKLNQLLDDVQAIEKWDPAVRRAARRAQSALHETHFALSSGDSSPARRSQDDARQTQVLRNRELDLENLVGIVFLFDTDALKDWNAEFAGLRKNIAELQRLQKNKASRDDVKQQLVQTDRSWETLVTRFKGLSADQILQLREDFGQVDQAISRLCHSFGIQNRRAPLQTKFLRS
jgi:hypothetical protein